MATIAVQTTECPVGRGIGGQVRSGLVRAWELAMPPNVTGYRLALAIPILQIIFPLNTGNASPQGDTLQGLTHKECANRVKPCSYLGTIALTD